MRASTAEKILVGLLRGVALAAMVAVVPVFMPHRWMEEIHEAMGMGSLPELPVVVYLTRSLSAMYVFHAGILWLATTDLKRYAALVTYLGLAFAAFGAASLWIDVRAGLPWFWIAAEGPFAIALGIAILALQRRRNRDRPPV